MHQFHNAVSDEADMLTGWEMCVMASGKQQTA